VGGWRISAVSGPLAGSAIELTTTPIVIGYLVSHTGSFDGALVYVGLNALLAVVSFGLIVGQIHRVELDSASGSAS
jgi:ACS family glucarate transporter-like MFS transporter